MKTVDQNKNTPVVLIIDDEIQIRRLLRVLLEGDGYRVFEAENGQLGLSEAAHCRPDSIILDLGLPDLDGTTVLKRLREWSTTPVLILSVRENPEEKIAALDEGADDYVTKPFEAGELLARLRAIQRRAHTGQESPVLIAATSICNLPAMSTGQESPVLIAGKLQIDVAGHEVRVSRQIVHLTPTEFALLKILVQYAGRVVTQRQLLREVWGPQAQEQSQYARVYMTHLRKKLAAAGFNPENIKTEPGIGYRLQEDLQ